MLVGREASMGKRTVPRIMLRSEAAVALGISKQGVQFLERQGELEVRLTVGGRPFYLAADVERLVKARAKGGR